MAATVVICGSSALFYRNIAHQILNGRCFQCCGAFQFHNTSISLADSTIGAAVHQRKPQKKSEKISKAMKSYLERAKEYDSMLSDHVAEYEIGKRHLANIMGEDPDSFTQGDIDRAISYLLPSGLFDKKARPVMKHPLEILPVRKAPQFGMDGRPFHFLFYTGKPNFYELMHNISSKLSDLKSVTEDYHRKRVNQNIEETKLTLHGTEWISKEDIEKKIVENISDKHYQQFVVLFERLVSHPLSFKEEAFILKHRRKMMTQSAVQSISAPSVDIDGREFMVATGKRKNASARVELWAKGTGQISINGRNLFYFEQRIHREQILYPLQFVNKLGEFDVSAEVKDGGPTGQSGALRLALSKALASFVDEVTVEKMRLAGLLTQDPRRRERKKPGQEGARKKFTWKKR